LTVNECLDFPEKLPGARLVAMLELYADGAEDRKIGSVLANERL